MNLYDLNVKRGQRMTQQPATIPSWFQSLLDKAPEAIIGLKAVRDQLGKIQDLELLFANEKSLHVLQTSNPYSRYFAVVCPWARSSGLFDQLIKVIESGHPWSGLIQHPEGLQLIQSQVSASKLDDGCLISCLDLGPFPGGKAEETDVDEESSRAQSSSILESIFDASPGAIAVYKVIKDQQRTIDFETLLMNTATRRAIGLSRDDVNGKRFTELFPAIEANVLEQLLKAADSGTTTDFEYEEQSHGKAHWFRITASRLNDLLIVWREEITSRKSSEQEIEDLNKALIAKNNELAFLNSELKTFNAITANDYSDTLRNLYINLEMIVTVDAHHLSNSGRANLRRAQAAIQRMQLLTDDLKAYTRLQELDTQKQDVDLNAIMDTIITDFEHRLNPHDIDVKCHQMPLVTGHPFLISLVFHHLIDNAIKFRKEEGLHHIEISCRESFDASAAGFSEAVPNRLYHMITVKDTGNGFPAEETKNIFGIFYRLHDKTRYKGSGIGLAICKKIMDIHGGFVVAESHGDTGASFHCFFPA